RPATANIPIHGASYFFAIWGGIFSQQRFRSEDHAGSAIATLERSLRQEGLLYGMQCSSGREPFNGFHGRVADIDCVGDAGASGFARDEHRTGATLAFATTGLGPGELHVLTKHTQ